MALPRRVQPLAVQIEPATPALQMLILAPKISRGGGRFAYEGDVVEPTPQERKTWLFWRLARDL